MKITNSEVIKSGEQELIDIIIGDLDWNVIEKIFKKNHNLGIGEDVEYKRGDIIIYNNQIAYKLEFDIKVVLSVLMDRKGNCISASSSDDLASLEDKNENELLEGRENSADSNKNSDSENEDEDALKQLTLSDHPENTHSKTPVLLSCDVEEKSSQSVSSVGELLAEMEEGR